MTLNGRPYDPATGLHYDSPYAYSFDYSPFVNLHIDTKHAGPLPFNLFDGRWATGVSHAYRISQDPRATPFQKAYSSFYVGMSYAAPAAGIVGGGILAWEVAAAAAPHFAAGGFFGLEVYASIQAEAFMATGVGQALTWAGIGASVAVPLAYVGGYEAGWISDEAYTAFAFDWLATTSI